MKNEPNEAMGNVGGLLKDAGLLSDAQVSEEPKPKPEVPKGTKKGSTPTAKAKKRTKAASKKRTAAKKPEPAAEPVKRAKRKAKILRVFIGPIATSVSAANRRTPTIVINGGLPAALLAGKWAIEKGWSTTLTKSKIQPAEGDNKNNVMLTLRGFPWATACDAAIDREEFLGSIKFKPATAFLREQVREDLEALNFEVMDEPPAPKSSVSTFDPDYDDAPF